MTHASEPPFRLRDLGMSVYLPTFLFAVGQGAVIPFTPLYAMDLGASVALASLIVALRGFGMMLFDIPAGILVGSVGERWAMVIGTAILLTVAVGAALTQSPWVFAGLMVIMGFAWAIWQLARLTYVSEQVPLEVRGRALSLLGGTNRVGTAIGPLLGGYLGVQFGLVSSFYLQAALALVATVFMFLLIKECEDRRETVGHGAAHERFWGIITDHRRVFATAGVATLCLSVVRASRQTIIPLWGDHIGLSAAAVGGVFSASSAIDMLLFYPTGAVMDRWGRKWVGIPCLITIAAGLILIPAATTLPLFVAVAMLTGFGNGMGAGINMTLGADFSPAQNRAEFLGVWRLLADVGQLGAGVLLSAITAVATLGLASAATGGVGLLGAVVLWLFVPEPLQRRRARPPEAA
ncbi:MAG: MFS transporter [Dehalococcoidia bacterium]|nr:MFS transporter [Dehalococcoidia bacterium]